MKERPGGHERPAVITAVKQDRKERRRYHIYIDGADEAALSVHEDIMVRYRLLKGQTVDPAVLDEIRGEDDKYRCYMAAVVYLGVKPRTRKEVERYLLRKGMEAEAVALTLDRLERERLVDDRDYAGLFAGQRLRSAGKGRRLIVQELRQRGVKGETAAEAADALDPAEELEVALALAVKKWRTLRGEQSERRRKLAQFLLRRGFPGDIVREALRRTAEDGDDDLPWLDN
ncbi:RecX family transcriptional regulator [Paenibacillus sp. 32O-W]|uniref:RecX family transcriptional regulator n=1 Tax=Paenibacillus sp. 32O-W TaxID=1695218 RepID=UPI00071EB508|nr:RecX family transcriptional regulator [Paenibacillus sp. 32O-W]ALS27624.1 RecX family transcriptional regulator [Paenibacillus sp. 32O-W]